MPDSKEFLVRGAKLQCAFGSHIRKLNLPQDHGAYTKNGLPMIHEEDCVAGKNISSFGICQRPGGEGDIITLEVPPKESHSNLPTYRPAVAQVLTGPACVPELISTTWEEAHEKVVIDDGGHKKTVTTDSFLICKHFGGIITVVTSGQEQEAPQPLEQTAKASEEIPPEDLLSQFMNDENMMDALALAGVVASLDGALPYGDAVGLAILLVASLYVAGPMIADGIAEAMAMAKAKAKNGKEGRIEPSDGEYKKPKSGSGKEKSSDVPSWARGEKPFKGESGKDFAERILNKKYGKNNYKKGPGSEYNQIKKWGDRGFE